MKKRTMSSPQLQPAPVRYSDLATDVPPPLAPLPFATITDPAMLQRAVDKVFALKNAGPVSGPRS